MLSLILATSSGNPAVPHAQAHPPSRTLQTGPGAAFASIDAENDTWSIGNSSIQATFQLNDAKELVLAGITNPQTGRALTVSAQADTAVTINGEASTLGSSAAGWVLELAETAETVNGRELDFRFASTKTAVRVTRSYLCVDGSPTLEAWTTIEATGRSAVTVSPTSLWLLTIPSSVVHYANGLRGDTADNEVDDAFALNSVELGPTDALLLEEQNRSTEQYVPIVAADLDQDEFFGGLEWSGSWRLAMQRVGSNLRITAGVPDVTMTVNAGTSLELPRGFFGFTQGGRADVALALRDYVEQGIRGGRPFQPLVTDNTWFSYGTDIDEDTIRDEMAAAASAGVELFVVDAGWYVGAGKGEDFSSGLGDWRPDPARFPNGLAPLREYAHELGMQFGLWVEPERVALSTVGRPGLAQQAWLATNNGATKGGTAAQLCFGSAAVRQWILDQLTRLLDDVNPDYLKWDNNFWINCNRAGHGHGPTGGNFAHVQGIYDVLDQLRQRYPSMLIENCSQGGNRADFGMLRFTDTAWMDDRTTPSVHVRHNLEGLSTFFPPAYLLSFAVNEDEDPIANAFDLPLSLRSRMVGILGLTYRAADLTEEDRDALAAEIGVYQTIRETQRDAAATLLTPQAAAQDGPAWDVVQEMSHSGNAIVFAFQNDGASPAVTVTLHGLQPGTIYSVTSPDDASMMLVSGTSLMTDGLEVVESPTSAAHVRVVRPTAMSSGTADRADRQ